MNDDSNLLIAAVFGESPDIMRYLLKNGFDINTKGRGGNRPILIAFKKLNTYLIKMLIREGADLTLKNVRRQIKYRQTKTAPSLLERRGYLR